MKLEQKDVEAVAKSRVWRAESRKTNYWIVGSVIAVFVGYLLATVVGKDTASIGWLGLIVSAGGLVALIWYMNKVSKKQNAYKVKLLKEWRQEQKASNES